MVRVESNERVSLSWTNWVGFVLTAVMTVSMAIGGNVVVTLSRLNAVEVSEARVEVQSNGIEKRLTVAEERVERQRNDWIVAQKEYLTEVRRLNEKIDQLSRELISRNTKP